MKEYKKPLVEVIEIETEDIITVSAGTLEFEENGVTYTEDYHSDIFVD